MKMYTLVEHNGLDNSVMMQSVTSAHEESINKAGGVLFAGYENADGAETKMNGLGQGMIVASVERFGKYGNTKINGNRVYMPNNVTKAILNQFLSSASKVAL